MQFDRGYLSLYFINDQAASRRTSRIRHPDPERKSRTSASSALLEGVAKSGRPLLIIAEDIEANPCHSRRQQIRGIVKVAAVKAPDLAIAASHAARLAVLTGGQVISEESACRSRRRR